MSALLVALPAAIAQEVRIDPYPYCNTMPNPQQVDHPVLIHVGCEWATPSVELGWEGLMVELTKPDGSVEMLGPYETDATGGTGATFTPTAVGTYYLRTYFPEQVAYENPGGMFQVAPPSGAIMNEAWSETVALVVQEEPIATFPVTPLPDEYWSRPIDAELWGWSPIAGNWLGDQVSMDASPPAQTLYADYNDYAPESGHVLWAKQLTMGGLAGGQMEDHGFVQGDAYEPKWTGAVIIGGKLFYNQFETTGGTSVEQRVVAVDLHTGEELWNKILTSPDGTVVTLSFGQVYYFGGYNLHGVFGFLWGTSRSTWYAFDPFSGRWVYSMEGVPSGTRVYGPNGEIIIYTVDTRNGWMTKWVSDRVVTPGGGVGGGSFNPQGHVYTAANVANGIEWNVTISTGLPGSVDKVREGIILGTNFDKYSFSYDSLSMWALSIKLGEEGTLRYNKTWSTPIDIGHYDVQDASAEDDVFCVSVAESRTHYGFRLSTGEQIWGPTEPQQYTDKWGYASSNSWDNIYDGKYFSGNYGGTLYCRDVQNGKTLWTYNATDYYNEELHNNLWRFRPAFFADGKVYLEQTEHNPFNPQHRGAPFICINITTGEEIWRIPYRGSEWSSTPIIGDSIIAMYNSYDQRIYAIGKGPSKTTVSIQNDVISLGSSVMIKGSVTDISPGTDDTALKLRFPDGIPAVSDKDMTDWMLYVYNQFERPADVEGVKVFLKIQDPNGDWYSATVTTDRNGRFSHMWAPAIVGEYHVTAMFEGSESYYPSQETITFGIDEAPAAEGVPSAAEIAATTVNQMPAYPAIPEIPAYLTIDLVIVILAAVGVVIGLIAYMALRKQK